MDKAPLHRRASWGKNQQSYEAYMRNDLAKTRSPTSSQDYGMGNFSYDNKYLSDWAMPDDIKHQHLPKQIFDKAEDWSTSGAALDTALERIDNLRADAINRGWPDKRHAHLSRPHWPSPTGPGAQSPAVGAAGSPISPIPSLPDTMERVDFTLPYAHRSTPNTLHPAPPMGMESPPITPLNAPTTPANPAEIPPATLPDMTKLNTQLSPPLDSTLPSPNPLNPASQSPQFDEHAWETYLSQFSAELRDLRLNALARFKGTARDIEKLTAEYAHTAEYEGVFKFFKLWWEGQRGKVRLYEERVAGLRVPEVGEVRGERERLVGRGL